MKKIFGYILGGLGGVALVLGWIAFLAMGSPPPKPIEWDWFWCSLGIIAGGVLIIWCSYRLLVGYWLRRGRGE